jgi:3-oxoacyl-[acyl-carrier-protein] synthase II
MKSIAVTGIGVVSSLGSDVRTLWDNLTQGSSGIETIPEFSELPVTFGGPAKGFDPGRYLSSKELRTRGQILPDGALCLPGCLRPGRAFRGGLRSAQVRCAHRIGGGGITSLEEQIIAFHNRGPRRVSPLTVPMFITNIAPAECAMRIKAKGPGFSLSSACATGGHAIAMAVRLIQAGDADCMAAGGVEAVLMPFGIAAFASMKALSTRNHDPKGASRPFSIDRDGFVMSEGGAVLILERYETAKQRGAEVLALVEGVGMSEDAYHMVAPEPEGTSVAYAIRHALKDAGLSPGDIGYINAHGTSTELNDRIETMAVKQFFGEHAYRIPMSSTKSMTGHPIGGAASLETAICILAMRNSLVPPTINLDNPDPECDLNYVPNRAIPLEFSHCLNNSFGFGGQNVALILGKDTA